jgi:TonB family protein
MLPSLLIPAVASASQPVDDATASTPRVRVSTGVIGPELVKSSDVTVPDGYATVPGNGQVGLSFTIDEKGRPENVQVTKSLSPLWDSRVVDAVRQFRYRPGMVSNEPIPIDMNLIVNIVQ